MMQAITRARKLERPLQSVAAGRYVIQDVLGIGGMAVVYRAHDTRLDLPRAVKILNPELVISPSVRKRFEMEARTMAKLHHQNIVAVYDIGVEDELAFMVMELIEGGSLNDRIKNVGYFLPRTALSSVQSILSALVMAHGKGVIHRDIKPHNVLVTLDGTPKLTDFGIAHLIGQDKALTASNAVIGTWAFMAPEQRKSSRRVTAQSDIYAVGATLYALVTARDPFDIYNKELQKEMFAGIPEPVVEVIERATRYWPEERYASSQDMLAEVIRVDNLLRPDYMEEPTRPVPVLESGTRPGVRNSLIPEAPAPKETTFDSDALDRSGPIHGLTPTLYPTIGASADLTTDPSEKLAPAHRSAPTDPRADAMDSDEEATPIDVWREKADPSERLRRALQRPADPVGALSDPVAPPRSAMQAAAGESAAAPAAGQPVRSSSPVQAVRPAPLRARIPPMVIGFALALTALVAVGLWMLGSILWTSQKPEPPNLPVVPPPPAEATVTPASPDAGQPEVPTPVTPPAKAKDPPQTSRHLPPNASEARLKALPGQ